MGALLGHTTLDHFSYAANLLQYTDHFTYAASLLQYMAILQYAAWSMALILDYEHLVYLRSYVTTSN